MPVGDARGSGLGSAAVGDMCARLGALESTLKLTSMRSLCILIVLSALAADAPSVEEQLWRHRNLGKAFYENPTTQVQAVAEFRKALDLAPNSVRERLNYGLALLRAGKTADGVAELEKVQKLDPNLPHTPFNLALLFPKDANLQKAIPQFD